MERFDGRVLAVFVMLCGAAGLTIYYLMQYQPNRFPIR
jgi:hypothetical protein